jgi:hypothetical protein
MQAAFSAANDQVATTGFAIPHSPLFVFALEAPWQADVHSSSSKMTEPTFPGYLRLECGFFPLRASEAIKLPAKS